MANTPGSLYSFVRSKIIPYLPSKVLRLLEKRFERRIRHNILTDMANSSSNAIICMVDGRIKHGGLADRLNGIVSTYKLSLSLGRPFKIHFIYPFQLSSYLVPNEYDWEISKSELYQNPSSKIVYLRRFTEHRDEQRGKHLFNILKSYPNSQLLVYTNLNIVSNEDFPHLFHRLFRPSDRLQMILDTENHRIKVPYVSATLRFQQLLGDFKEGNFNTLSDKDANELIRKCKEKIAQIHLAHPDRKLLITSDSIRFLKEVEELEYVVILTGKPVHMEYNHSNEFDTQAKAFIDLLMLADAEILYSIVLPPMYNSGFPKLAARINDRPFNLIEAD